MQKGGKYRRLVGAFERIFGATIFFGTDTMAGKAKLVQRSRFNFLREAQIWYDRNLDQPPLSHEFENVFVLSDEFYRETRSHPIPTDLEAVKVLAGAPAALDLFMWLSYRCFVASGQESIRLFGERGLANQLKVVNFALLWLPSQKSKDTFSHARLENAVAFTARLAIFEWPRERGLTLGQRRFLDRQCQIDRDSLAIRKP